MKSVCQFLAVISDTFIENIAIAQMEHIRKIYPTSEITEQKQILT